MTVSRYQRVLYILGSNNRFGLHEKYGTNIVIEGGYLEGV